ncbi:MAG TPA: hypothetical protein VNO22_03215 [Planctomycetota bacterium]|jgi:hypothetical protein|nr:hypothetical protein [Planctomycetota bacterium]
MRRTILGSGGLLLAAAIGLGAAGQEDASAPDVLGSAELFWVPTLDQAVEMARATGKPIFSMGYSLVPDGTTYTRADEGCPRNVF